MKKKNKEEKEMQQKTITIQEPIESKDMVVKDIQLNDIKDNPFQPRARYGKLGIKRLTKNIHERGLFHPIAVVKLGGKYVIVSGHRRFRAFKLLRRKTIPAIIRKQSTQKDLALDLAIENALRKDFTPIEKAKAIFQALCTIENVNTDLLRAYCLVSQVKLMNERGIEKVTNKKGNSVGFEDDDLFKCQRILNLIDVSENAAIRYLRLLTLPKSIQNKILINAVNEQTTEKYLAQGIISIGFGYELSRVNDNKIRLMLYDKVIKEKLRYIQLKHIVNEILANEKTLQVNKLGTSQRKGQEDYGLGTLTKRSFNLSSSLWNFRRYMPILSLNLDKVIFRASLQKLKKACLNLVDQINDLLRNEVSLNEKIEICNREIIEVEIRHFKEKHMMRFTLPMKLSRRLSLENKDKIRLKIEEIIRNKK